MLEDLVTAGAPVAVLLAVILGACVVPAVVVALLARWLLPPVSPRPPSAHP